MRPIFSAFSFIVSRVSTNNAIVRYLFIVALALSAVGGFTDVHGQAVSQLGRFSVEAARGCVPHDVRITILDTLGVVRNYIYEPGLNPTNDDTHTYLNPGSYWLRQISQNADPREDSLLIEVFEPLAPEFMVFPCPNGEVAVSITDNHYDFYRVFFTSTDSATVFPGNVATFSYGTVGTFTVQVKGFFTNANDNCGINSLTFRTVNTLTPARLNSIRVESINETDGRIRLNMDLADDIVYTIEMSENGQNNFQTLVEFISNAQTRLVSNLNTRDNYYCFRILAVDECNGATITSNVVCSSTLGVESQSGSNIIRWRTDTNTGAAYVVTKDGNAIATITAPLVSSYEDTSTACGEQNCYSVTLNYPDNSLALNIDSCVVSNTTAALPPIEDITASVNKGTIELSWPTPQGVNVNLYTVTRTNDRNNQTSTFSRPENPILDQGKSTDRNSFSYEILYSDSCGNMSTSSVLARTMFLEGESVVGNAFQLDWNPYEGWMEGVRNYFVEIFNLEGTMIETEKVLSGETYRIDLRALNPDAASMRIRAVSLDPNPQLAFSNEIVIQAQAQVILPNAFTPNNDGINDVFEIQGRPPRTMLMRIYNRWGTLVFVSIDPLVGWNGLTRQGGESPVGTYLYTIEYSINEGETFNTSGSVLLLR